MGTLNGQLLKIQHTDFVDSMNNYLELHGYLPKAHVITSMKEVKAWFQTGKEPTTYESWWFRDESKRELERCSTETDGTLPPLRVFLDRFSVPHIIVKTQEVSKCEDCGTTFFEKHKCNTEAASFYTHKINKATKNQWKFVKFLPLGTISTTRRVYIVYDIETYTQHGDYGKQLVPFLLAMNISGDPILSRIAKTLAIKVGYETDPNTGCYYSFSKDSNLIGSLFKTFRHRLQKKFALALWQNFTKDHENIPETITFEELMKMNKKKELAVNKIPYFWEIIIVGHNISGFDEIVLATHVTTGFKEDDELRMFNITRTFMPRAGKLLFNDVSFLLPNPKYQRPTCTDYKKWQLGQVLNENKKYQGLKFMVRDTFLLTHCSLKDAAKAYGLQSEKGSCPYKAVNEFFMLGTYEAEVSGYPVQKYWNNESDYLNNKPKQHEKYSLTKEVIKYCILDVCVTTQLMWALIEGYSKFCNEDLGLKCSFNIFQRPTISSNTHMMFKQVYYRSSENPKDYMPEYMIPTEMMYDFVRKSVRGGRCYPNFLGVYDKKVYVYDVCGMYASALTHPLPIGHVLPPSATQYALHKWQNRLNDKTSISYFDTELLPGIVTADCFPPEKEYIDTLPPICIREEKHLYWTNEEVTKQVLTTIDLVTMHNRGWTVNIDFNALACMWPKFKPIAREYVKLNIIAKEEADKTGNSVKRSISKLLSNALYGSFCTKLDKQKVIFEGDMTDKDRAEIRDEEQVVKSRATIISNMTPEIDWSKWEEFYNLPQLHCKSSDAESVEPETEAFIHSPGSENKTNSKITFTDVPCNDLILTTLESTSTWIENRSYPTQLASFVLAWTRAFTSEWADILYGVERGKGAIEERDVVALYGDTDSLFLTENGHQLMLHRGAHRLKRNKASLIFDPQCPRLTWAVECETVCPGCGNDAYSTETCFLAPKLYALKEIECTMCKATFSGKLRGKGHPREQLSFKLFKECFTHYDLMRPDTETKVEGPEVYKTHRTVMKKTLTAATQAAQPFTVLEKTLTRTLRPWKELTLRKGNRVQGGYFLYPFDRLHPNPRITNQLTDSRLWESI